MSDKEAINNFVNYVLGYPDIFLITTGDIKALPLILKAVANFQKPPADDIMRRLVRKHGIKSIF